MGRYSELFRLEPDPFDSTTPPIHLRVCLFRNVVNAADLRKLLAEGKLQCSLIRAEMVLEIFQLLAAANKAIFCQARGKLSTKNVHSEIVYALSPTKNITESLLTFGIQDTSQDVLVAIVGDVKGDKLTEVGKKIKGRPSPLSQLQAIANYDLVKHVYHVKEPELNKATIVDAIVSRIVAKDYVS